MDAGITLNMLYTDGKLDYHLGDIVNRKVL